MLNDLSYPFTFRLTCESCNFPFSSVNVLRSPLIYHFMVLDANEGPGELNKLKFS